MGLICDFIDKGFLFLVARERLVIREKCVGDGGVFLGRDS